MKARPSIVHLLSQKQIGSHKELEHPLEPSNYNTCLFAFSSHSELRTVYKVLKHASNFMRESRQVF